MRWIFALVLLAGPALAEGTAETRFGALAVAPATTGDWAGFGEEVRYDGRVLPGINGRSIEVDGVWAVGDEDVVLLQVYSGGNDVCSNNKQIVAVSARGATVIEPFGWCAVGIDGERASSSRFEVDLRVPDPRLAHITAIYAAGRVVEVPVDRVEVPAPMPGAGEDVSRWAGAYPYDVLEDPGERRRFLEAMPREKLFELQDRMAVASANELVDGWLIARGCMAHQCNVEAGAFALEVATGRLQAVIFHDGAAPEIFGAATSGLMPALETFARSGQL